MKEKEDILNLEVQGVLQKWSRHVKKYQRRFFRCQRDCISYFHYKGHPPAKGAEASWYLDLKDVVRLEKLPQTLSFELYNAKDERLLMCKLVFGEYKLWTDVLESKINYLRERGEVAEEEMVTRFDTNTFTMLSLMSPAEVDELAQTTLDELLLPAVPRPSSSSSSSAGEVPLGASAAAAREVGGEDEEKVEEKQQQHLGREQIESMAHRLGDGLAVMEELCLDLLSEMKDAEASSKRRLCGRLFGRYYASLEAHLLLHVGPVLGEEVLGVDLLMKQSLGTIMALFECRKRVQQFDVAIKKAAEALSDAANGREGSMGTTVSVLSEGSSALESLLVTEGTLVASIVSLTLREVKQRWNQETEALTGWFAPSSSSSSASTALSSSSSVSLDSPRRERPRGSGKWGRSLIVAMPTIITNAIITTTPRRQDREPPLSLHLSAVFGTIGTILTGLRFDKEVQEDDELQTKAHYLRSKAFSSTMLYLTGELQTLPVQHVRDRIDEAVVVALLQDLAQCRERVGALQAKYLGGKDEGTTDRGGGDDDHDGESDEVVEVFVTALERFMADKAAAAILDHFLRTDEAVARLVGLLFVHPTWVQGDVAPLLVKLLKQFLEEKLAVLPSVVHDRFEARVLRSFLFLYLRHFLKAYVGGKHFDAEETMQCMNDENTVREWVDFRGKWACREARMEQLWVLKAVRVFLLMPLSDGLGVFSDIYVEGTGAHPGVILHLYDLLRYCLKLRTDVSPSDTTTVLAVVGAFVAATSAARVGSPPPMPSPVKLLLELFPQAGQVHITGEPWSLGAAAAAAVKGGGGSNPVSEETMLGITSLVMTNAEKMRAAAKKAALYSSPEHRPVVRVSELESLVGGRKEAEVLEGRVEENGEHGPGGAGGIVVGKEQEEAAATASAWRAGAGPLTEAGALGEMAEKEVVKPPVRRRMGMPFSPPSSPTRMEAPPSPQVKLLSPSHESPPSSPTFSSSFQRQASPPLSPPSSPRPPSMPTAAGPTDTKDKNGTRAQAVARHSSSSSTHSAARPTSSGSSSVTNPFEDEDKESPKRSAFGGMFGRRRDPMPAQPPPPQSTAVAPPSPRPSGASASPGKRRFRNPFAADPQVEAPAPSAEIRWRPEVEPALPSQPSESGPRRFGGGWRGDEVGKRSPQALPSRAARVPVKQQQQHQEEQGGRRSFGGGKW